MSLGWNSVSSSSYFLLFHPPFFSIFSLLRPRRRPLAPPFFLHLRRRVLLRCSTTQITLSPYRWLGHATTWTKGHGRTWISTVSRITTYLFPSASFHTQSQSYTFQREAIREISLDNRSPRLFRKRIRRGQESSCFRVN